MENYSHSVNRSKTRTSNVGGPLRAQKPTSNGGTLRKSVKSEPFIENYVVCKKQLVIVKAKDIEKI